MSVAHVPVLSLALAVALTGCATLMRTPTQPVIVLSRQPGASVRVAGREVARTPATLVVRADVPLAIEVVTQDGRIHRCPDEVSIIPGFLAVDYFLQIGLFVDAFTGAWLERAGSCFVP